MNPAQKVVDAELVRSADEWAEVIKADLGRAVEGIVAAGRNLIKAKADVRHGEWLPMLKKIGISRQAAHQLMTLAENPAIANDRNCGHLPTAARALYELSRLPAEEIEAGIKSGAITPDMTIRDAKALVNPTPVEPEPEPYEAPCIHCGETLPLSRLYEGGAGYECDPCVSPDEPELPPLPENYMNLGPAKPAPAPTPTPKPVIGIDGKTYNPKPATPKASRRKPITDAFDSASFELRRAVERVVRLCEDDRLEKNKDQIVGANLSDLVRARDTLTRVIQQLKG